jgi:hypothetical protein
MHERDAVRCDQCGETIDARAPGVAQRVHGWRVNRIGGGANYVALPEPEPHWLCRHCLDKRKAGFAWQQLGLFDEG